jgi:hypothetical protein
MVADVVKMILGIEYQQVGFHIKYLCEGFVASSSVQLKAPAAKTWRCLIVYVVSDVSEKVHLRGFKPLNMVNLHCFEQT